MLDLHTHTNISYDGNNTPEDMCERAIELGLSAYAITDHVECNFWYPREHYARLGMSTNEFDDFDYASRFEMSLAALPRLKERYKGRLNLIFGCEMGQATQAPEIAKMISECDELDFIIGSLHQVRKRDDFYFINLKSLTDKELDRLVYDYFLELFELARMGGFDVMGHITYPLRYIVGEAERNVDMTPCREVIHEMLKVLIDGGRGIEINTSGLRQRYGLTFPTLEYLMEYRQLGGEVLTIGSDSHCSEDLGKGIAEGLELAKQAGFRYVTYFANRKPQWIKLNS